MDNARAAACLSDDEDEFHTFTTARQEYNQLNITGISEDLLINNDVIFDTSQLDKYTEDEDNILGSYTARSHLTQATPRTSRLYEKKQTSQQGVSLRDPLEHHQIISRASECIKNLKTAVNSPINTVTTQEESNNALTALKMMDELDYSSQYEIYQSPYEQKLSKIAHLKAKLTEKASPRYMEPKKQVTPPKETFSPQLNSKSAKSSPRYLDFMKSPKQEKTARQMVQEKKDLELSRRMPNSKTSPNKTITSPRNISSISSPRSRSNSFKAEPPPVTNTLPRKNSTGKKPNLVKKPKRSDDNVFEVSDMNESLEEENLLDESIEGVLYDNDDDNEFSNIETTLNELDEIGLETPPDTLFITPENIEAIKQEAESPATDIDIVDASQSPEITENDEFEVSNDEESIFKNENLNTLEETALIEDSNEQTPIETEAPTETFNEQNSISKQSETENQEDEFEQVEEGEIQETVEETPVEDENTEEIVQETVEETPVEETKSLLPESLSEEFKEEDITESPSQIEIEEITNDSVDIETSPIEEDISQIEETNVIESSQDNVDKDEFTTSEAEEVTEKETTDDVNTTAITMETELPAAEKEQPIMAPTTIEEPIQEKKSSKKKNNKKKNKNKKKK